MKLTNASLVVLLPALLAAGCAGVSGPTAPGAPYVVTTLQPTSGHSARGTIFFSQEGSEVVVRGQVTGLAPGQEHGFHVHEKGDCSSPDAMSAGGHLNPDGKRHGPLHAEHHAGDLPSLKADASGRATVRMRVPGTVLGASPAAFAGKALIVHVSPDDYATQPTGNSGARIACGLISNAVGRDAAGNAVPLPRDL